MEEPSLLDYLKEKLNPRKLFKGETESDSSPVLVAKPTIEAEPETGPALEEEAKPFFLIRFFQMLAKLPWRSLFALALALMAQSQLEPPAPNLKTSIFLYFVAGTTLIWALLKKEWQIQPYEPEAKGQPGLHVRTVPLIFFVVLLFVSFISFGGNQFTLMNVLLWLATLIAGLLAFWETDKVNHWVKFKKRLTGLVKGGKLTLKVDPWHILVLAVFLLGAWFHLTQLNSVPINMTSDHTEKLLDISNVLNGQYSIFFQNNSGREPIQFYLTAMLVKVFNMGMGFFTLKFSMALAFLVALIYAYLLGNEVGGRWTGLFFMAFLGFASWTNILARVGMRVVLCPVFVVPTLYYLFRGIRTAKRNDFILAGILTGLGLLGYSAFRVMPIVVALGVFIYLASQKFDKAKKNTWWALGLLALFAVVMFLPMLRFAVDYPDLISYRTLTRMTAAEQPIQGSAWLIFLENLWKCAIMPFWKDGTTWVISVVNRPGLDVVSAALYFLGLILVIFRWLRTRAWQDLFLLISIPVLMIPSTLALAFPIENPSLSRAGGAVVPILLICAIGFNSLLKSLWKRAGGVGAKASVAVLGIAVIGFSAIQNYDITLKQYGRQYVENTWNTTQMADVVQNFIWMTGKEDNVWVVSVPYWVDTRLVAISAGYIGRDYAVWPVDLETTLANEGAKLFIAKADDAESMTRLQEVYPNGYAVLHTNEIPGRDFYVYLVLP